MNVVELRQHFLTLLLTREPNIDVAIDMAEQAVQYVFHGLQGLDQPTKATPGCANPAVPPWPHGSGS